MKTKYNSNHTMKKLLPILLFFVTIANGQIVNIPDANFKAKLVALGIDTNSDGNIQNTEALAVTTLNVYQSSISDLTGIEAFTNLTELNCGGNQLTTLNVNALINLTKLYCYSAQLTSINVVGLSNLSILECDGNQLSSINLSGLSSLTRLKCGSNQLTSLNVTGNTLLNYLDFSVNQISTINLSANTGLVTLAANQNNLTALNVTPLINLRTLYCAVNQLTSLNVNTLSQLRYLYCYDNQITSLNVSSLSNLLDLRCHNNQMTTFSVSGLTNLDTLEFGDVNMNPVNVSTLVNLTYLAFHNGLQTSMDFSNLQNMNALLCYSTKLTSIDVSMCSHLNSIYFTENNDLTYVNMKSGRHIFCGINNCPQLDFICANENDISEIVAQVTAMGANNNPNVVVNSYCSFVPGGNYNTINGTILYDLNNNGCGTGDFAAKNLKVNINDGTNQGASFTNSTGNYTFYTGTGNFTLNPILENPSYFNLSPSSALVNFPVQSSLVQTRNFCLTSTGVHPDLEVVLVPVVSRPGFDAFYKLVYRNKGTQVLSGNVNLTFDDTRTDFIISNPTVDNQNGNNLSWNFSNLVPFETRTIYINIHINSPTDIPPVNDGDFLDFIATINPINGDEDPDDNTFVGHFPVVNSMDPNNIMCLEGDLISTTEIGKYLHYFINFENTGSYYAENVVVKTTIDASKYNFNSLQLLDSSNPVYTRINGNTVEFIFQNINLAAASGNPPVGGHGDILFKIKSNSNLVNGDFVSKKADIFFDYNAPITTNDAITTYQLLSNPIEHFDNSIKVFPNPAKSVINIKSDSIIEEIELYDVQGRILERHHDNSKNISLDISNRESGIYFIKIKGENGSKVEKLVKE
jgi:Leucine-rich repeat (LRR) protein